MKSYRNVRTHLLVLGSLLLLSVASPLLAQNGKLRTRIDPRVAGVFVDGKYRGTAAMFSHEQAALSLAPGSYKIKIVDPRHKDLMVDVGIQAGKTTTIRRKMEPANVKTTGPFGELATNGFGNAAIYLNGKYYANTAELDNPAYSLLLPTGSYDLKIVPADGSAGREEKITINADETLVLSKNAADARRK